MSYGRPLALSQNIFVQPPAEDAVDDDENENEKTGSRKRQATVYDAVAGRLAAHGFLSDLPFASRYRDTASSSANAVHPEEALFRRLNAPIRYEETDLYFAHEKLPSTRPLPSTDLLESVHAYTSDFYERVTPDGGHGDFQSMDETALIAMGVLLEEMAKEAIGKTGDLVLVEGEEILDDENEGWRSRRSRSRKRESTVASSGDDLESVVRRKRRKMVSRGPSRTTPGADTDGEERRRAD